VNERARELVWAISRGEQRSSHELLRRLFDSTRALTVPGEGRTPAA
jgi:hypothetical protein